MDNLAEVLLPEAHEDSASERILAMLRSAFGESIGKYILDPEISDIIVNPDGKIWIDSHRDGRVFTGQTMKPEDAERVIYIVATSINTVCNKEHPILQAELPGVGSRFQGELPPVATAPHFVIRNPAARVFTLSEYVERRTMTNAQYQIIANAVAMRSNMVVAGGTGSGKTTLINAILSEIAKTGDRLLLLEDTKELQCAAKDYAQRRTVDGIVDMRALVRSSLRLRPDRIIVGELRGPEALDWLKACNTGHPGSLTSVHADSARQTLSRIEQLVFEAGLSHTHALIGEAIDLIIYIERTEQGRKVMELISIDWSESGYKIVSLG